MEKPTNDSRRLIAEGAVVALVQGKIDRLEEKVARDREQQKYSSHIGSRMLQVGIEKNEAAIGALKTVIGGLRFIDTESEA